MLNKVPRNGKNHCYAFSILLHPLDNIHTDEQKFVSSRNLVQQNYSENVMYRAFKEVLEKMVSARTQYQKETAESHWTYNEGLENVTLIRHFEGKRNKGKHRDRYLRSFCKWTAVRQEEALEKGRKLLYSISDWKLWRAMISYDLKEAANRIRKRLLSP